MEKAPFIIKMAINITELLLKINKRVLDR
jgi:hypothetical protein